MKKTTIGDYLYASYAGLAMADAATREGAQTYRTAHYMIRSRMWGGLRKGTIKIGSFAKEERLKIRLPHVCAYCGSDQNLSADHLHPKSAEGSDSSDNIVWACRSCNSSKGAKDLLVWMESKNMFPPINVLRRYLKLAIAYCEEHDLIDVPVDSVDLESLPFELMKLPQDYPPPSELVLWTPARKQDE